MLFPIREDEGLLRGVSNDGFLSFLNPRLLPATEPKAVALFPFSEPVVRSAIHEAKYHGSERAFTLFSLALAEYLRESDESGRSPYIIPVPLGEKRLQERGFNQMEEIVRRAVPELGIEINTELLIRARETVSQVSLPRSKRGENMRGAFRAMHPADPSRTYIVVDDVVTTGATLQAASNALREAGAVHIVPLALAH